MNHFNSYKSPVLAINYLGERLAKGELILFLGAGASDGFGLPDWTTLVNNLRGDLGLPPLPPDPTSDQLQMAADECEYKTPNKEKFRDSVRKHLYPKQMDDGISANIFDNHLLLAVAALLMGSKRGHINRVVTLNYDSMLEWFLRLYGFVVRIIADLPAIEGAEDIRIYHPHGYLPHTSFSDDTTDFLILTRDSIDERWSKLGDPWIEKVRHLLLTGVGLFVGMSGKSASDRALSPLFKHAATELKGTRPVGLWLIYDEKDPDPNLEIDFSRNHMVPHFFKQKKEIPDFLLKICQAALNFTNQI